MRCSLVNVPRAKVCGLAGYRVVAALPATLAPEQRQETARRNRGRGGAIMRLTVDARCRLIVAPDCRNAHSGGGTGVSVVPFTPATLAEVSSATASATAIVLGRHPGGRARRSAPLPAAGSSGRHRQVSAFTSGQRPGRDRRFVRHPGTYSPPCADRRLLAAPRSCRRVAACNPN